MSIFVRSFFSFRKTLPVVAITTSALFSTNLFAKHLLCPSDWLITPQPMPVQKSTSMEGDQLKQNQNIISLKGQVELQNPNLRIQAQQMTWQAKQEKATAWGQVELQTEQLLIQTDELAWNKANQTGMANNAFFQLKDQTAHGNAKTIELNQAKQKVILQNSQFTTCPFIKATPEKNAWTIDFANFTINQNTRRYEGESAKLVFKGLPIFYAPQFSFPMDERASGWLFPEVFNYQPYSQQQASLLIKAPYYINLAPNFDNTLTPLIYQDRGLGLDNEFRYLEPNHQGTLELSWLQDSLSASQGLADVDTLGNTIYGEKQSSRWRAKFKGQQQWHKHLTSEIDWHEISDPLFYQDVPLESDLKNLTQMQRHLRLNYRNKAFFANIHQLSQLALRGQNHSDYDKKPEITLGYQLPSKPIAKGRLKSQLLSQHTEFDVPFAQHSKAEGQRNRTQIHLQHAWQKPYVFAKTQLQMTHLNYQLHDNGFHSAQNQTKTFGQFAFKTGLNFERQFNYRSRSYTQTLEPKMQYLYVPYQQQNQLPIFDTQHESLAYSNLFSLNRFTGGDRIGDANQIALGVTSQFINPTGHTFAELSLGQIFYLADRQVQINNTPTATDKRSDYFVQIGWQQAPWYFASTSQLNETKLNITNQNNRIKLDLPNQFTLKASHQKLGQNANTDESLALGINWQITPKWRLGSYINYDFNKQLKSDLTSAIRYDDCCWATEFSLQETQLDNGLYNYSLQWVFQLKGLSTVGNDFSQYLNNKLNF